jgi:DNA-binding NtrC family response regulator
MKSPKGSILVVEDDKNQRTIIKTILVKEGYCVEDVGTGKKALEILKNNVFDLVLTDLRLPDLEGTEILREVKVQNRPCRVVIVTAYGSIPSAIEATKLGAFHYLEKPLEKDHLLIVVSNAINQVQLLRDNIMLKDQLVEKFQLENIVGDHGRMQELYRIVKKVAPTSTTVLIYGASGTGKELFAKSIHYNSPRKGRPFFAINCAAIPETLLESELFGYEKGAFTGAVMRHAGLFEQANGSTLFLDEIGDLTLTMQAKILRALQEKEIRRIGGKETIRLDVRILAATNKKLAEEIARGRFRQDLYYRLNVIAFTIPPLNERMTDIPLLVEHFLRKLNEENDKKIGISPQGLQALMDYSWPGNIRQLESVIERSYIMCECDSIDVEHMPEEIKQAASPSDTCGVSNLINDSLIDAKLTASEYRLYLYLVKFDSTAPLPDPKTIIERLGINRDTFFTAVARLAELGLYDYRQRREADKLSNGRTAK